MSDSYEDRRLADIMREAGGLCAHMTDQMIAEIPRWRFVRRWWCRRIQKQIERTVRETIDTLKERP